MLTIIDYDHLPPVAKTRPDLAIKSLLCNLRLALRLSQETGGLSLSDVATKAGLGEEELEVLLSGEELMTVAQLYAIAYAAGLTVRASVSIE